MSVAAPTPQDQPLAFDCFAVRAKHPPISEAIVYVRTDAPALRFTVAGQDKVVLTSEGSDAGEGYWRFVLTVPDTAASVRVTEQRNGGVLDVPI